MKVVGVAISEQDVLHGRAPRLEGLGEGELLGWEAVALMG